MAAEKSPAFQFYPKEFLTDRNVAGMSLQERGAYITLLCLCWQEGWLPADLTRLANMVGAPLSVFRKFWPAIEVCFVASEDRLVHPRLEKEREKQANYKRRQSDKGKASAATRKATTVEPRFGPGCHPVDDQRQPKGNSPSPSPSPTSVEKRDQINGRSNHPFFKGQRFVVFDWQLENLMRLLGPLTEDFDLHEWFFTLDRQVVESREIVPQKDGGKWLEAKTLTEAQRRGLLVTAASPVSAKSANLLGQVALLKG